MKRTKKPKKKKKQKKEEYRILALDVATKTGFAVENDVYGVWDLTTRRDESKGMRIVRFRAKLKEILKLEKINLVVFERPGGRHTAAVIVQSELQGQLKQICEKKEIPYRAYSSKEIKKFATGNGNAGKPTMVAYARKNLDYKGTDDNEADALWILELAKSEYLQ